MRIDLLRPHQAPPGRTPVKAGRRRGRLTALALVAATALFTLPALVAATPAMAQAGTPPYWSQNPTDVPSGVGESLPFVEYEAVNAANTGTVIGPSFAQGTLPSEATDREAVQLSSSGQYVKFTLTSAANAVDLHYAVPQGSSGTLSVYVNGTFFKELPVTAAYSYISTGDITGSDTHKFYDDARLLLGQTLAAGSTVSFQVGSSDTDTPYTVNVADFYNLPAATTQPANTVSVVTEGADPTGANDSTSAFNAAITAANNAGEAVWIPSGTFKIGSPLSIQKGTIEGAGSWYSQIETNMLIDNTSDVAGPINLSGFAILGSQVGRNDSSVANGIDGSLGSGWTINGLWIQDTNVGMWLQYGNSDCTVENTVIESTDADGINFNGNASSCTVKNNFLRNTGDDGLAIWSYPAEDSNITLENNTVVDPTLANGIADYGGSDNTIENNVVADTNPLGSGIDISNEQFLSPGFTPLAGTINVTGNYVIRSGAYNPNWDHPMGAVQFDPYDYSFSGVTINYSGGAILDSPYEAFELVSGDGDGNTISGLNISNVQVQNAGTTVFQAETTGTASVSGVTASGIGVPGTYNYSYPGDVSGAFTFNLGSGNSGWSTTPVLTAFPNPVQPGALAASPTSLSFGDLASGSTSAAQAVTISNPGTSAVSVSSVALTGNFSQTNNCGSSIAAGGSCTVEVTFSPTSGGALTGTLTVTTSAPGGPLTVALSGTGVTSTTNLALNQPIASSSNASGFPATDANDGNTSTYWESLDGSAYPQTLTVNLGSVQAIGSITLDLPPSSAWSTRTETLSVLGSTNGSSFSQIVGSAGYTFNPSTGNTVTIGLPSGTSTQYVQLSFTGNTGWSAAQVSEFEVFPGSGTTTGGGGSATLSASPSSVAFGNENTGSTSAAQTVTISNTGTASASISGVSASAPFGETNTCGSTLAAGASCTAAVTFAPTAAGASSGDLTVSSNATNSTLSVALTGTGVGSTTTNLALNKSVTASSYTQTYVPANAVDGNTSTYWESVNGTWPATFTVNLGSTTTLGNVVIDLPPSSAWQTRTQTLSILGSTNDSTWTTLVASATYTWNPSTGNTVSINLPSGTAEQYVELSFTANNVQNGAQMSELEIFG